MVHVESDENILALRQWSQSRTLGQTEGFLRLVRIGGEKRLQFVPTQSLSSTHPPGAETDFHGEFSPAAIVDFLEEKYSHMMNEAAIQEFYRVHRGRSSQGMGGSSSESVPISHLDTIILAHLHQVDFPQLLDQLQKQVPLNEFGKAIRLCFKNNMPVESKRKLRGYLQERFPQHARYLHYRAEDGLPVLQPPGIEQILTYLRTKSNPVIHFPCPVCETPEIFLDMVRAIDETTHLPQTFIVRCHRPETSDPAEEMSAHVTPFYVSKTPQGKIRLFWTDSIGGYQSMVFQLVQFMQDKQNVQLFYCDIKRQMDDHSCSAFAIHDIIQANKHPLRLEALMDDAGPMSPENPLLSGVKTLSHLPLPFMLTAQSYTLIQKHFQQTRGSTEQEERAKLETKLQRFQQMGTTSRGEEKIQNTYVERRMDKYEGILWSHIIGT